MYQWKLRPRRGKNDVASASRGTWLRHRQRPNLDGLIYASISHMKRTTVFLDEGVEGDLRAVARRRKEPVAATIREALERFVAAEAREGAPVRFLAVGRSGRRDTARRHEELVWKDLEPHGTRPSRARSPRRRKG